MDIDVVISIAYIKMPAGEYWVGDPCYAVPDDRWIEWLEAADYENPDRNRYLYANLDEFPIVGISTRYGDGVYMDQNYEEYPVDAGLIGVVPVGIAKNKPFGMHRVNFPDDFKCVYDEGKIILGHIIIDTDPSDESGKC